MARRREVRRVSKKSRARKNKISQFFNSFFKKKLFAVSMIFFAFFVLALSVISIAEISITGYAATNQTIFQKATGLLEGGIIHPVFLRWTLFITLAFLIHGIFSAANFPFKGGLLNFILSMLIAFIATAMVKGTDLTALIQNYGAIGYVLIAVLPLAAMFLFTSQLLQGGRTITPGRVIFQFIIWFYYAMFSFYLFISYFLDKVVNNNLELKNIFTGDFWVTLFAKDGFATTLITFSAIIPIIVLVWNATFRNWVRTIGRELHVAAIEEREAVERSSI